MSGAASVAASGRSLQAVTVLGATGSIGSSTLDVLARNSARYEVFALTANTRVEAMESLCRQHRPRFAVMQDEAAAEQLRARLADLPQTQVMQGVEGLCRVAGDAAADVVVAGIVGAAGLLPTLAAVDAGKRVLLANKEALVMTGDLLTSRAKAAGARLLPVDSEHNALFQCMPQTAEGTSLDGVSRLLLTASGGPFRGRTAAQLADVTPAQAVAHPNWSMGRKISVDSATLMNKGLELIEACFLFAVPASRIDVVVHPQSIIHSLVSYRDGSVLAQLGNPDMRTPIAHALAWPERIDAGVAPLDLFEVAQLNFERPDTVNFPCLRLAREAVDAGGTATAVLNAANEVAVAAFLDGNAGFMTIPATIEHCLGALPVRPADTLDAVLEADAQARECAAAFLA
ncbi:1-deoxy-D-xylulose-5-phosphate reductoisomerase [Granulosicoccaceae sp. 1_MG-2023]|nr:1-deoxy-D-xylulose-5-phosphate reductoisomerase [Granulosicoccaceae sp. 1_MG-2023]